MIGKNARFKRWGFIMTGVIVGYSINDQCKVTSLKVDSLLGITDVLESHVLEVW